ncbi:hypothetical protein LINPERPRIM_LOCUS24288 [Linum perenne]
MTYSLAELTNNGFLQQNRNSLQHTGPIYVIKQFPDYSPRIINLGDLLNCSQQDTITRSSIISDKPNVYQTGIQSGKQIMYHN